MLRKTVLITGCTQGSVGDALARTFHQKGMTVFAASRRLESMEHLKALGIKTIELDVTDKDAITRARDEVSESTGGKLDLLFNNAGRSLRTAISAATDYDMDDVRSVFEANVYSVMLMCKEFVPLLIASGNGMIVNVGSLTAIAPMPFSSSYNATKAAVMSYTNTLRIELAPLGVHVCYLSAGEVKSNVPPPAKLPAGSLYAPMEKLFNERRANGNQDGRMDTAQFAETVVAEYIKDKPRAWFWAGANAMGTWILDTFLPKTFWDNMLTKRFGLDQFAQTVASGKSKDI